MINTVQTESVPEFLARIGKKIIRPGGMETTVKLLEKCNLTANTKVLEVACNVGTTAIHIAKQYGSYVDAVDLNAEVVQIAKNNIKQQQVDSHITVIQGDALDLPFEDNSFDIVINEAMLTALPPELKGQALKEYGRVLKSGGLLLTHDLLHLTRQQLLAEKQQPMEFLSEETWRGYYDTSTFEIIHTLKGDLNLFTLQGVLKDEGFEGLHKIFTHLAGNQADQVRFFELVENFHERRNSIGHIAFISKNNKEGCE